VLGKCPRDQNCVSGVQWAPKNRAKNPNFGKCNLVACETVHIGSCTLAGKMKRAACLSAVTTVLELTRLVAWCAVTSEETPPVIGRTKLGCDWSKRGEL
jgi:hypothetical protein